MHFLSGFRPFSRQPLEIFRRNSVRSETKWIQSRCKRPEAFRLSHFLDIQPQNSQKSTKIDQNLWMIQKFFKNFFFAFLESTYFNSRKNAIKKFSADFPLYDGLGLRKIFKHFWMVFLAFSCQPLEIFRRNLVKSETKWIQCRCKKTRGLQIKPFCRYLASKQAKIDQNRPKFMDDPKIFRNFFFCIFGIYILQFA